MQGQYNRRKPKAAGSAGLLRSPVPGLRLSGHCLHGCHGITEPPQRQAPAGGRAAAPDRDSAQPGARTSQNGAWAEPDGDMAGPVWQAGGMATPWRHHSGVGQARAPDTKGPPTCITGEHAQVHTGLDGTGVCPASIRAREALGSRKTSGASRADRPGKASFMACSMRPWWGESAHTGSAFVASCVSR